MNAWQKTRTTLVLAALFYLTVFGGYGELHLSSTAFVFFSILWLVQAASALRQAWRHPQSITSIGTSATDDASRSHDT